MDEITPEKAIIKRESRCQAVTLLVHDLTFDGVMTGSLSHSQSALSSRSTVPSVFLLLRLLLRLKHSLCQSKKLRGSMEAIDPDYCKIRPYKCEQVGCEHNRKVHSLRKGSHRPTVD